tara:strand:- start:159 stop:476 length:318 start_codon:yes stop_codon:yes gene_type:complete
MFKRDNKGQFIKGYSGNPSGRPKNNTITDTLRRYIKEDDPNLGVPRLTYLVCVLFEKACEGDLQAIKMIMDRVDGLPTKHVETTMMDAIKVIDIDVGDNDDKTKA